VVEAPQRQLTAWPDLAAIAKAAAEQEAASTPPPATSSNFKWSGWNAIPAGAGAAAVAWGVTYATGEGTATQTVAALTSGVTAAALSLLVTSVTGGL
jgi:hypothetical protein